MPENRSEKISVVSPPNLSWTLTAGRTRSPWKTHRANTLAETHGWGESGVTAWRSGTPLVLAEGKQGRFSLPSGLHRPSACSPASAGPELQPWPPRYPGKPLGREIPKAELRPAC